MPSPIPPKKKVISRICAPRTPARLKEVIDSLEVETDEKYQKRVIPGAGLRTFCNHFAEDFCAAMGVAIPKGLLARRQIQWLTSAAARNEYWFENVEFEADKFANQGHPVLVTWLNPDPSLSSHIAVMRAAGRIAQAGNTNFSDGPLSRGFGARLLKFFVHL